jgi:hypothetical protein
MECKVVSSILKRLERKDAPWPASFFFPTSEKAMILLQTDNKK